MSIAIIDARKWQNQVDLKTGEKNLEDTPKIRMVRDILARHPYPGDVDLESNRWVSYTALDLVRQYQPRLACLIYAFQYFALRYKDLTEQDKENIIADVFQEVGYFLQESGYTPVIVGTGEMIPVAGSIDLNQLDGLAVSSHWLARYAGLHNPSDRDLELVRTHPMIDRVVSRQEWITLFPGVEHNTVRIPDYLVVAREGWTIRATGTPMRKAHLIPSSVLAIPVSTPLGLADSILDIKSLITSHLEHHRIALIILEGIGIRNFTLPYRPCLNGVDWYCYEPGDAQFLTISTGTHQVFTYPTGYLYHEENESNPDFPYSGYFKQIPERTVGYDSPGRSIAVGNRSMLTHMVFGADISIECFARNLYNQGCMGVIHR
jgi:hypothetical protein